MSGDGQQMMMAYEDGHIYQKHPIQNIPKINFLWERLKKNIV